MPTTPNDSANPDHFDLPDPIDPEIAELLSRRWSGEEGGEIPGEDTASVQQWIAAAPERAEAASQLARLWERVGQTLSSQPAPDVHNRVLNAIAADARPSGTQRRSGLFTNVIRPRMIRMPATRVVLPLVMIALIAVLGIRTSTAWRADGRDTTAPLSAANSVREYITHRGESATVQLVDGTTVVLGPESRLSYRDFARGVTRAVTLQGIAHFTVAHDPKHPFVVYANNAAVQELGTAFSVTAYPEDSTVNVVVFDGRVALRDQASPQTSGTVLVHADAAALDLMGLVTVRRGVDLREAGAWTEKRLVFHGARVAEVITTFERWYDLKITVRDQTLLTQTMRGEFVSQSVDNTIAELAKALGARYEISGRSVVLY